MNDISIKSTSIKTNTTTARVHVSSKAAPVAAAAEGGYRALLDVGFDERTATHLAQRHSIEVIERQLAWLPLRQVKRNRLGLLRRAIEQDWPKPELPPCTPAQVFVAHFEAAVHGLAEPMFATSSLGQPEAEALLNQLAPGLATEDLAAEWGRRFAQFVARHRPGKTAFSWCARDCGPEFIRAIQRLQDRAKDREAAVSREAARKLKQDRYEQFLVATLRRYRCEKPELWKEFQGAQDRLIAQFGLTAIGRGAMASEVGQAGTFAEFARERGEAVPKIEDWH